MLIDPFTPPAPPAASAFPAYSSPWWLDRLGKQIDARAAQFRLFSDYYQGRQPLAMATQQFRDAFGKLFGRWSDNMCRLVVQALEERLSVQGFHFGDKAGDAKAWRFWQANKMDAQSQKAHREAILKGDCPIIVWPGPNKGDEPTIRVQKPEEIALGYDDDPLVTAVAMKRFKTLDDQVYATLYYPDRLEKYVARREAEGGWDRRAVDGEPWPLPHDLGVVPVVPILNDPNLDNVGTSEIAQILPLQDALNKLFIDLLVSSEYSSFRQRWATGIDIPLNPETGKPIDPYKASVDRIWSTQAVDAKFGDFEQTNLSGIISAIETAIQHMATLSRTPAHYLLGQSGTFPSGESLKSTETGLVAKAHSRTRDMGEGWEEVERLAFVAVGDRRRGQITDAETIWRDPETRTEAEHVDALVKLASIGVPEEQLWADAGYTPQQIELFLEMRAREPQVPVERAKVGTFPETATGPADASGAATPGTATGASPAAAPMSG